MTASVAMSLVKGAAPSDKLRDPLIDELQQRRTRRLDVGHPCVYLRRFRAMTYPPVRNRQEIVLHARMLDFLNRIRNHQRAPPSPIATVFASTVSDDGLALCNAAPEAGCLRFPPSGLN